MLCDERPQFMEWYEDQKIKNFREKEELFPYWMDNVSVLRQASCALRTVCLKLVNFEHFRQAITISTICNKVFRTMYLKPDTVVIPKGVYRMWDTASLLRFFNGWRTLVGRTTLFMPVMEGRCIWQGYKSGSRWELFRNKIFERLGCFWHGCPCMSNRHKPIVTMK